MRIKTIEIENFKGINKKVKMSFNPNPGNGSREDKTGFFKQVNNQLSPNVVGIIGRNGIGKTTILESLLFLWKLFKKNEFERNIILKYEQKNLFSKLSENKSLDMNQIQLTIEELEKSTKKIRALNNFEKFIDILNEGKKEIFEKNCHQRNKSIMVKVTFIDNNDTIKAEAKIFNQQITRKLSVNNTPIKATDAISYFKNEMPKLNFFKNNICLKEEDDNHLNKEINSLLNLRGEEILSSYLKAADSNIKNIVVNKKKTKLTISKINLYDGDSISIEQLSYGTKKFIILANFIEQTINRKGSTIILIDEIDNFLHNKLAAFFLRRVSKAGEFKDIQLIFTTHSPVLMEEITYKQGFVIINDIDGPKIKKISSIKNNRENSSFIKKYIEQSISSHPSKENTNELLRLIKWKIK